MKLSGIAQPLEKQFNDLLKMDPTTIMQTKAPEFLKIAALEQLNKARQPNPQPPQGTVAEQVVKQAVGVPPTPPMGAMPPGMPPGAPPMGAAPPMPPIEQGIANLPPPPPAAPPIEQGLASLPAGNMQFSDGGIVSFAEGDVVEGEEEGEGEEDPSFLRQYGLGTALTVAPYLGPLGRFTRITPFVSKLASKISPNFSSMSKLGLAGNIAKFGVGPATLAYAHYLPDEPTGEGEEFAIPEPTPQFMPGADALGLGVSGFGSGLKGLSLPESQPSKPQGIPDYKSAGFKKGISPEEVTIESEKARIEKAAKAFGVDPNFYKELEAQNEARLKELDAKKRETLLGQGLMEAGAAIASGESPFALANIGKGLGAFAKVAGEATERQETARDTLLKAQQDLKVAQREENAGRADIALANQEQAKNRILEFKNREIDQQNEYVLNQLQDASENDREWTRQLMENYRTAVTSNVALAAADMKNRVSMAASLEKERNDGKMTDEQLQQFVQDRVLNGPELAAFEAKAQEDGSIKNRNYPKARQAFIESLIPVYLKTFGAHKTRNERYGQPTPAARSGWSFQAVD